ncbi:MAG: ComEC family competence protein [bacterium]|nr:ComEC family competence protein [bacterium]
MPLWMLRRKLHVSWLLAVAAGAVLGSIAFSMYSDKIMFGSVAWLLTGSGLCIISFWKRYIWLLPVLIIGASLIGLWRGSAEVSAIHMYDPFIKQTVTLSGVVSDDPSQGKAKSNLRLRLKQVEIDGQMLGGIVWVDSTTDLDIKRGDRVIVKGSLADGFGTFSASMYRASVQHVERPEPGDVARRLRDWFGRAVNRVIPEPEASLGLGYLVGQRRNLPKQLDDNLRMVGLVHVVVASGFHLSVLVRLTRRLFARVSKYSAAITTAGVILGFLAVTGLSPSMIRASLVSGLSLLAWYYGRKFNPLVLLIFVAGLTVLYNPSYLRGDMGWMLSFAAFGGVMILAPLLQRYFFGNKKPGTVRQILGETVAAQLVTLPIVLYGFGYFSNVALVANLLVLPFVFLAMILVFVAGVASLSLPAIAAIFAGPAILLIGYMVAVINKLAALPWAVTEFELPLWAVYVAYLGIIAVCIYLVRATRFRLRDANIVE